MGGSANATSHSTVSFTNTRFHALVIHMLTTSLAAAPSIIEEQATANPRPNGRRERALVSPHTGSLPNQACVQCHMWS
jgi:hypothetical protein